MNSDIGRSGVSKNIDASSDDSVPFDHRRVDPSIYNNLEKVRDVKAFTDMVKDYMAYVRAEPHQYKGWDEDRELDTASMFVAMINNEKGWTLASNMMPEFQSPTIDTTNLPDPLRYILDAVESRLPMRAAYMDKGTPSADQVWEEDLAWRSEKRWVEYLGWQAGRLHHTSDDRLREIEKVLETLQLVTKAQGSVSNSVKSKFTPQKKKFALALLFMVFALILHVIMAREDEQEVGQEYEEYEQEYDQEYGQKDEEEEQEDEEEYDTEEDMDE